MSSIRYLGKEAKVRYVLVVEVPVLAFSTDDALEKADAVLDDMVEESGVSEVHRMSEWIEMGIDKGLDVTEDE